MTSSILHGERCQLTQRIWNNTCYAMKISHKPVGGGTQEDLEDNIISDSLAGHIVWCNVIQLSSKSPPESPWLDLDAACIHHCTA